MKRAAIVLASAIAVAAIGGCSSTATTTSTTPAATPATASAAPTAGRMGSGGPPSDRGPGNGVGGGMGNGNGPARPTSGAGTAAPPAGTVAAAAWAALMSPEGEYAAASYQAVIGKFGDVEPYVSIEAMEQNHIQALTRQLSRFGFVPPANPYAGTIAAPADLVTAAQAWVDGERKNVALYDRLAAAATGDAGVTRVFTNLRRSSLDAHLPLFEAAVKAGGFLTEPQMAELGFVRH